MAVLVKLRRDEWPLLWTLPLVGGSIMRKCVLLSFLLSFMLFGCAKQEDTTRLNAEIGEIKKNISFCETDLKKFGEGSPLYFLVAMRCSTYKQTLAMLEQKRASHLFYFKTDYQVNGNIYQPPMDLTERLPRLEGELKKAQVDLELAKNKANEVGGLMAIMAVLEAETKALNVAQLEYQLSAYRNGYPPYLSPKGIVDQLPEVEAVKNIEKTAHQPKLEASNAVPTKEEIEAEMLKSAVEVRFKNKKYRPDNYRAGEYDKLILLEFEYENKTEKEIRAFTGMTVFMDVFDRPFLRVNLTVDDRIPPGKKIMDKGRSIKMNEFNSDHKELVSKEMENIKFRFEPRSILFTDGTQLGSVAGK